MPGVIAEIVCRRERLMEAWTCAGNNFNCEVGFEEFLGKQGLSTLAARFENEVRLSNGAWAEMTILPSDIVKKHKVSAGDRVALEVENDAGMTAVLQLIKLDQG